jgi:hypothetical protein
MTDWHWLVASTAGIPLGEITNATQRQVSFLLRDACYASWNMDAMDPQAAMITELQNDLLLYRGNKLMFRGRIGSTQDTLGTPNAGGGGGEPDAHTVQFSAIDYRSMLGFRVIQDPGLSYTNVDQGLIAWDIINRSMNLPGGNWGITQGRWVSSVQRTTAQSAGTLVQGVIDDLSNLDQGFEWEIDANLKFNIWPVPTLSLYTSNGRGANNGIVLTYGDNVMAALRSVDATYYANDIRYAGEGSIVSTTNVVAAGIAANWGVVPQGRWTVEDSNTNITDQPTLNAAALLDLNARSGVNPNYSMTLTHGWWNPSMLWVGDVVQVVVQHGRVNESFQGRVSQIDIYQGDAASEETTVVTVGRRMGSLLRRLPTTERKLEQIAKHA